MKLLCIEVEIFSNKTKLLNFKVILPLTQLEVVGSRSISNGLVFSDDNPVDIQLVIFLLLSSITELSIGEKTKKF